MLFCDAIFNKGRDENEVTEKRAFWIGVIQCVSMIPGVSRSGATISAGLLRGFDRVAVTKLSFFLGIPALVAAGALQAVTEHKHIAAGVGWGNTLLATAVSAVVGYAVIAWLLKYVAHNNFSAFIWYRVILGGLVIALLASGVITAV